jgi:glycosyltransferase involved in cell wall biosynthesis
VSPGSASIVITTRNRKEELRRALRSCFRQTFPTEVLVLDDGSEDGTSDMVLEEFPKVNLQHRRESKGYIVRRNEAASLASGAIIFSIDDDAEFSSSDIIQRTMEEFEHPEVGAIAIPFKNVNRGSNISQRAPDTQKQWVTNEFIGTAYAVRRDLFLRLGGYRECLVHQGEEGDFCIRMLAAGYLVKLGTSSPILHYESPRRDTERVNVYGQRNLILFAWVNVPFPWLLLHMPATLVKGLVWGLRHRSLAPRFRGALRGARSILQAPGSRHPVNAAVYKRYRLLKKRGPIPMESLP